MEQEVTDETHNVEANIEQDWPGHLIQLGISNSQLKAAKGPCEPSTSKPHGARSATSSVVLIAVKQYPAGCSTAPPTARTTFLASVGLPPDTSDSSRGLAKTLGPDPHGPRNPVVFTSTPSGARSCSIFKQFVAPSSLQLEAVHTKMVFNGSFDSFTSVEASTVAIAVPSACNVTLRIWTSIARPETKGTPASRAERAKTDTLSSSATSDLDLCTGRLERR